VGFVHIATANNTSLIGIAGGIQLGSIGIRAGLKKGKKFGEKYLAKSAQRKYVED
jgi:hypothetical protein